MSPLRIIIIVILCYIAYRLIFRRGRSSSAGQRVKSGQPNEMPAADTLVEDPVCKKLVPSRQAVQLEWHGRKIYFCSKECCNTFRTKNGEN